MKIGRRYKCRCGCHTSMDDMPDVIVVSCGLCKRNHSNSSNGNNSTPTEKDDGMKKQGGNGFMARKSSEDLSPFEIGEEGIVRAVLKNSSSGKDSNSNSASRPVETKDCPSKVESPQNEEFSKSLSILGMCKTKLTVSEVADMLKETRSDERQKTLEAVIEIGENIKIPNVINDDFVDGMEYAIREFEKELQKLKEMKGR